MRSPTKLVYKNFTVRPATLNSNQNHCNGIFKVKKVKQESRKKRRESGILEERAEDGLFLRNLSLGFPSGRGTWSLPLKAVVQVDSQ